jgi:phosphatidylglycerophosphate synthase|tara:strand:- start:1266 stop:1880 length:615 start_codon:yes stop_codon:yes gene_type:complete
MIKDKSVFNLANYTTAIGIILTGWLILLIQNSSINYKAVFILVFLICLSDLLDGWLARSRDEVTLFGGSLDKARDKLFSITVFVFFLREIFRSPHFGIWLTLAKGLIWIILVVELCLIITWIFGFLKKYDISSHNAGKIKTTLYFIAIAWWFFVKLLEEIFQQSYENYLYPVLSPLLFVGVFYGILSLIGYLQRYTDYNNKKEA